MNDAEDTDFSKTLLPPAEHRNLPYHRLTSPTETRAVWNWDCVRGVWQRGGKIYKPAFVAATGWIYAGPVTGTSPQPADEPVTEASPKPADEPMIATATGMLVPLRLVPARYALEDQAVRALMAKAEALRQEIHAFKLAAFADVAAFMDLLAAHHGAKRTTGTQGGVTLDSYDGLLRVKISTAHGIAFGPELVIAKNLIDTCIESWSRGSNENLRVLINDAFKVGDEGRVRVDRVLGLKRLPIQDETWRAAMVAIDDAIKVQSSRHYVRFYKRADADANWEQVVLDLSRA